MADFVAVLPSIWPAYTEDCLASMAPEFRAGTLVVDNADGENIGVAASWNRGVDRMTDVGAEWLILISAAVRFGESGGCDFLDSLDEPGLRVMEALEMGWHLVGFHREVFEKAGRFDTNYWPGGYEDLDFGWRIAIAYGLVPPFWDKRPFDVSDMGWSHSSKLAGVVCDPDLMIAYTRAKWGRVPGHGPVWRHPFGDESLPVSFQPPNLDWRP